MKFVFEEKENLHFDFLKLCIFISVLKLELIIFVMHND